MCLDCGQPAHWRGNQALRRVDLASETVSHLLRPVGHHGTRTSPVRRSRQLACLRASATGQCWPQLIGLVL